MQKDVSALAIQPAVVINLLNLLMSTIWFLQQAETKAKKMVSCLDSSSGREKPFPQWWNVLFFADSSSLQSSCLFKEICFKSRAVFFLSLFVSPRFYRDSLFGIVCRFFISQKMLRSKVTSLPGVCRFQGSFGKFIHLAEMLWRKKLYYIEILG